jgi:hypothetical protein
MSRLNYTANINKKRITDDGPDLSACEKTEQICFDQMPLKAFIEEMKKNILPNCCCISRVILKRNAVCQAFQGAFIFPVKEI